MKVSKGDWGFITGDSRIEIDYWIKRFHNGIFGRVIEIQSYYSRFTGKELPKKIIIRAYTKDGITHLFTSEKYFKKQT